MENAIRDFIRISKYAGMRNDLAQAGGGNTSVKLDDRVMLVKSSGFQLADVSENNGYSRIDYRLIVEYFQKNVGDAGEAAQGTEAENAFTEETGKMLLQEAQMEGGRASIETFLHAITGKYTLHSHPALVNILTARVGGMDTLHTMFPEAVLVPYRKPGAALAEAYYKQYRRQQAQGADGSVIFLANHGLVVSGDSADQVIGRTEEILQKIAGYLQFSYEACPNATKIWKTFSEIPGLQDKIVYLSENRFLACDGVAGAVLEEGTWNQAFCPDCVVYGSKKPLFLSDDFCAGDITAFMEKNGVPAMVCFRGHFYILAESVKKAQEMENVMSFAAQVQEANLSHGMHFLDEGQQDELLNWDAEKFRRQL